MVALTDIRVKIAALPKAELVVMACGLLIATPLWVVERPPLQDLPQHIAAVRVLSSYSDPSFRFAEYFELTLGRTQYLTVYLLAALLAKGLGPLVATKLVLTAALVATPYCLLRLLRAVDYSPWLSLLALPLVFNVHVAFGFLNFVAAIPLLFWGLELAVEELACPKRRRSLLLGVVLLATFFTHVVPFGILVLGALALTPLDRRSIWRRGWAMLPAGTAALMWLVTNPAGRVVATMGRAKTLASEQSSYQTFGVALRSIPDWLLDIASSDSDDMRLTIWLGVMLSSLVLVTILPVSNSSASDSSRLRSRLVLGAAVPASLLAYVTLPAANGFIWPICQRFPLMAVLFSIVLLGRLPRWAQRLAGGVCVVISLQGAVEQSSLFRTVEKQAFHGFDEMVEQIPLGSRVATLVFDRNVEGLRLSPLMHAAGWVQVARGGLVMFTFAEFPNSPFRYRAEHRPPPIPPRWEWVPERVKPDQTLAYYDYVLVHGWTGSLVHSRRFARVAARGTWSLWRRADHEDESVPLGQE